MMKLGKKQVIIFILIAAVVIGAVGIWYYYSRQPLDLKHEARQADELPLFLGYIKLRDNFKPIWVYYEDNRLYVNYHNSEEIDELTAQGQKIKSISARLEDYKAAPQGMAIIEGQMLVADYVNGSLGLFDKTGKVVDGFFERPDKSKFKPLGVASKNKVYYVTDELVHGWMAIGNDGVLINVTEGVEESRLEFPYGIAVTADGRVVITDPVGGSIKVFSCAGQYVYDIPTEEIALQYPQGVAIDSHNRIHVVDNGSGKVFVFDNLGKFIFSYGQDLKNPATITINEEQRVIYVADTENSRLAVWGY